MRKGKKGASWGFNCITRVARTLKVATFFMKAATKNNERISKN